MENINSEHIIYCPYCNREYFPGEIFMPKHFLGTASHMTDDIYFGNDMELSETYNCDKCGNIFVVEAEVKFNSKTTVFGNFNEDFCQNSL